MLCKLNQRLREFDLSLCKIYSMICKFNLMICKFDLFLCMLDLLLCKVYFACLSNKREV